MSKVILGAVILFAGVSMVLMLFIIVFTGALVFFSGKGKSSKKGTVNEETKSLPQGHRIVENKTL